MIKRLGSAITSAISRIPNRYVGNVVFHDTALSSTFLTRLLATFSEVAYIYQFSYVLRVLNVDRVGGVDGLEALGPDGARILEHAARSVESFRGGSRAALDWEALLFEDVEGDHPERQLLFVRPVGDLTQLAPVLDVLENRLDRVSATGDSSLRLLLDQVIRESRSRYPAVHDLAHELSYRVFDQPFLDDVRARAFDEVEQHLAALAADPPEDERVRLVDSLVSCSQPLKTVLSDRFASAPAALRYPGRRRTG